MVKKHEYKLPDTYFKLDSVSIKYQLQTNLAYMFLLHYILFISIGFLFKLRYLNFTVKCIKYLSIWYLSFGNQFIYKL